MASIATPSASRRWLSLQVASNRGEARGAERHPTHGWIFDLLRIASLRFGRESELTEELHLIEVEAVARHGAVFDCGEVNASNTDSLARRRDALAGGRVERTRVRADDVAFIDGGVSCLMLVQRLP